VIYSESENRQLDSAAAVIVSPVLSDSCYIGHLKSFLLLTRHQSMAIFPLSPLGRPWAWKISRTYLQFLKKIIIALWMPFLCPPNTVYMVKESAHRARVGPRIGPIHSVAGWHNRRPEPGLVWFH